MFNNKKKKKLFLTFHFHLIQKKVNFILINLLKILYPT